MKQGQAASLPDFRIFVSLFLTFTVSNPLCPNVSLRAPLGRRPLGISAATTSYLHCADSYKLTYGAVGQGPDSIGV